MSVHLWSVPYPAPAIHAHPVLVCFTRRAGFTLSSYWYQQDDYHGSHLDIRARSGEYDAVHVTRAPGDCCAIVPDVASGQNVAVRESIALGQIVRLVELRALMLLVFR